MEKIWLKSYPPNVPAEINPDIYPTLIAMLENSCQRFRDRMAYCNLGTSISYAQLDKYTRDFAAFLQQKLGLKKGDRVAIMLPNLLQYPIAMFGILRAGLIVVNVNPLYTAAELAHQLKDSGAQTIIAIANFANVLEKALPETNIKHVIVTEIGDMFSFAKRTVVNFVVKRIKRMVPAWHIAGAILFRDVLAQGKRLTLQKVELQANDIAYLQYTGGTTGVAKGAMLSHRNMVSNVLQALVCVSTTVREGETVVIALPMYHIFSLTVCCLSFLTLGGHGVLITNPRDLKSFIKELSKIPFSVFIGVNTLFNALLHHPDFAKLNFGNLRLSVAGGMAMQKIVAEKWHQITGSYILEGYGLTEASPVVSINPSNINRFTASIGLPVPSTDIKICNDEGQEVPIGEAGDLFVKGPQVMLGYWQKEAETKNVLSPDGWLATGDIVRIDEQGFLYIVDRKKDMIIVSGFNVYPNEVEEVIASHPKVLEVGVVGVPNEQTGEAVKAFVVKKDSSLTEKEILDFCHENLTRYKIPKSIEFRNELPKSNVGKILRRKLKEL